MASKIYQILLTLRSSGIAQAARILSYTQKRNRLEAAYQKMAAKTTPAARPPGRLVEARRLPGGARLDFDAAALEIDLLAPDLARLSWQPGQEPLPYALARCDWPPVEIEFEQTPDGVRLSSSELQLLVAPDGGIQWRDSSSRLLRDELPPLLRNGVFGPAWTAQAPLRPEECLYGLGEQSGPLNLRGVTRRLWNTDPGGAYQSGDQPLYMPVPVLLGLHGGGSYLVFYENYHPGEFRSSPAGAPLDEGRVSFAFESGMLRYYFIPGPPQDALERFSELTGRPGLPPLWSLGYHQSRWGYHSQAEIGDVVRGFQAHDLPLSAIHLDIDYMDGYRVFTVDPQRFPDLGRLASELQAQGVQLVTILDPGVKQDPSFSLYQEGLKNDFFCQLPGNGGKNGAAETFAGVVWPGWSAFPDFTNPAVRSWWSDQYPALLEQGVVGFWHDMNEPTSFTTTQEMFLPRALRHDLDGQGGDHRQAHNLYALLMNRAGYEGLRQHAPQRRPWLITRSGWAGIQRYAWKWTGDTFTSWEGLKMTIATVLGTGLSGQPFNGPDIGGFSGNPSAELYLRWFQMAAFMPFFRTHSAIGVARREPWVYGEPYTRILRETLRLRYSLLPYLYSLAWQASQDGSPLVRPLFWDSPQDPALWQVDDAFLLGPALLVAPLLQEGQTRRTVRLPAGSWYSLWDGEPYKGPGEVEIHAGLEHIPVLARGGSLLPLATDGQLALHLYAPGDAFREGIAGQVYSDLGDGYGPWRLDAFHLRRKGRGFELSWRSQGDLPFPYPQVQLHLHGWQSPRAWAGDQPVTAREGRILTAPFSSLRIEALR